MTEKGLDNIELIGGVLLIIFLTLCIADITLVEGWWHFSPSPQSNVASLSQAIPCDNFQVLKATNVTTGLNISPQGKSQANNLNMQNYGNEWYNVNGWNYYNNFPSPNGQKYAGQGLFFVYDKNSGTCVLVNITISDGNQKVELLNTISRASDASHIYGVGYGLNKTGKWNISIEIYNATSGKNVTYRTDVYSLAAPEIELGVSKKNGIYYVYAQKLNQNINDVLNLTMNGAFLVSNKGYIGYPLNNLPDGTYNFKVEDAQAGLSKEYTLTVPSTVNSLNNSNNVTNVTKIIAANLTTLTLWHNTTTYVNLASHYYEVVNDTRLSLYISLSQNKTGQSNFTIGVPYNNVCVIGGNMFENCGVWAIEPQMVLNSALKEILKRYPQPSYLIPENASELQTSYNVYSINLTNGNLTAVTDNTLLNLIKANNK